MSVLVETPQYGGDLANDLGIDSVSELDWTVRLFGLRTDDEDATVQDACATKIAPVASQNHVEGLLPNAWHGGLQRRLEPSVHGNKGRSRETRMRWMLIRVNPENVRQ